ncbi:Sterile alpha motif domain-containing protein, putative isoform 3 [Theobroma cacao]|uniref:Sterile alpha motif domain-containing protein, putative isoform 3 n=1 Tax=Theobroma cacao TaxID=3641 RepID=A0A061E7J0_THECC|nr:Sterile alpha motif domain-containing protein, putative isoform 3 [Theobroma cacao]
MAEDSRGRVTITLGRRGQVVKRAGPASDVDFSDSLPVAGSKRSVRDRLGSNVDGSLLRGNQLNNKRQRGDGHTPSLNTNGLNDVRIGKDDLRLKLMQKNVFRRAQSDDNQKVMDLREKLSRMGQPPLNSYEARQRMPDPRERMPESRETSILGRIPSTRSADDLPRMTSSRSSFSPWTLDHLRQRSPDRVMGVSRGLSPPRNAEELQRRPLNRTYDDVRAVPYMGKDVLDAPRPVSTASFVTKSTVPTTSAKPMPPGRPIPPPSSIVQKSSYSGDEQQTVEGLLHSLGLGKYVILFKAEEVDMTALKQMGENDLKELGIPMVLYPFFCICIVYCQNFLF